VCEVCNVCVATALNELHYIDSVVFYMPPSLFFCLNQLINLITVHVCVCRCVLVKYCTVYA